MPRSRSTRGDAGEQLHADPSNPEGAAGPAARVLADGAETHWEVLAEVERAGGATPESVQMWISTMRVSTSRRL